MASSSSSRNVIIYAVDDKEPVIIDDSEFVSEPDMTSVEDNIWGEELMIPHKLEDKTLAFAGPLPSSDNFSEDIDQPTTNVEAPSTEGPAPRQETISSSLQDPGAQVYASHGSQHFKRNAFVYGAALLVNQIVFHLEHLVLVLHIEELELYSWLLYQCIYLITTCLDLKIKMNEAIAMHGRPFFFKCKTWLHFSFESKDLVVIIEESWIDFFVDVALF
ncbi:hypothetical protein P8452_39139 [Trifolium repens]|nr:hypothetical protein P8452_39139 [Trifolium repens]